ncbi:MAG: penicillin-binding protein 2 [Hyphomicrobiaceae bacterium]|nr:penicillin-binding protein 2 [Hyphomicrobiaceae bacterium]
MSARRSPVTGSIIILSDGSTRAAGAGGIVPEPPFSRTARARSLAAIACVGLALLVLAGQLVRLALMGQNREEVAISTPIATGFARPEIVDRNGRLIAADVPLPSLFANPSIVIDRDEMSEKLTRVLPDLDAGAVRASLADKSRRFVWLRRGLAPALAQQVHDLGLPGLGFRDELRRIYPAEGLAGHAIGYVDIDNRGQSGIERYLDEQRLIEPVQGAVPAGAPPVSLSIDIGVQHALEQELAAGLARYRADAGLAIVMDAISGEVIASASVPGVDPARPTTFLDKARLDRVLASTYEMGSVLKVFTIAMALEEGLADLSTTIDVRQPIEVDGYTIAEHVDPGRPLSLSEILARSSNVGVGRLALAAGAERQRRFFERLGLTTEMKTELGPVARARLPGRLGASETVTLSYGHGLALAPLQLLAATAALVNGGTPVTPTWIRKREGTAMGEGQPPAGSPVVSAATSAAINHMLREVVVGPSGTGRRADVPGFEVGGKTGTAEIVRDGRYDKSAVIASFLGAFPMSAPRYVILVSLFEPQPTGETGGAVTAAHNAAPTTAAIVARIAPRLGVRPIDRPQGG